VFGYTQQEAAALPPPPSTSGLTLTLSGAKLRSVPNVTLRWAGTTAAKVDIYRDGGRVATVANTGSYLDKPKKKSGTFRYQVCEQGTSACSNTSSISF
jgi:hypothetical protein